MHVVDETFSKGGSSLHTSMHTGDEMFNNCGSSLHNEVWIDMYNALMGIDRIWLEIAKAGFW